MIVHDCEQNSDQWLALRAGLPTASEFHRIVTSKAAPSKQMEEYARQLAAELYAGRPLDRFNGNAATERGHELEMQARLAYAFLHDCEVEQIGFVTNHGAGASPDGLVGSDGLVEIKCLLAKNHVAALEYFEKHGTCPPDYIAQARGQMLICDRQWVQVFMYHPALPEVCVRIERDGMFDICLLEQLERTIAERDRLVEIIRRAA